MALALYTDFELLVHYAMRTVQDKSLYEDFLVSPSTYMSGDKYILVVSAVKNAVKRIMNSFKDGLFFKAVSKYGVQLQRCQREVSGGQPVKNTCPCSK